MYLRWTAWDTPSLGDWLDIRSRVLCWAQRHPHITWADRMVRREYRLSFDHPEHYTLFALTWDGPGYQLVDRQNH